MAHFKGYLVQVVGLPRGPVWVVCEKWPCGLFRVVQGIQELREGVLVPNKRCSVKRWREYETELSDGNGTAMQSTERKECRYKCLVVDKQFMLAVLNFHRGENQYSCLPIGGQIPADAIIDGVEYRVEYRGFLLRIWSSEFPIVPDGAMAPMMDPPELQVHNMREYAIVPKMSSDWSGGNNPIEDIERVNQYARENAGHYPVDQKTLDFFFKHR